MARKPWTEEMKRAMSEKKRTQYASDPTLREKISSGTKRGMDKPEARAKFELGISNRDQSGEKNPFFGKKHTEETKRTISEDEERAAKISVGKTNWWNDGRVGKTVEELYGEEIGKKMREDKSERMSGEKNPAFGKVYEKTGTKIGRYKGKLFRGILEYSYYKQLEKSGVDLSVVQYEPFKIPYTLNGGSRTYTPDFVVGEEVIEVKPEYIVKNDDEMMRTKREAAAVYCETIGKTYRILTEKDIQVQSYRSAYSDPDVEWIKR